MGWRCSIKGAIYVAPRTDDGQGDAKRFFRCKECQQCPTKQVYWVERGCPDIHISG